MTTLLTSETPAQASTPRTSGTAAVDAAAAALYPAHAPHPPDKAPNAAVQAIRDADPARVLYPPEKQLGRQAGELALASNPLASKPELRAAEVQLSTIAMDMGFDANDINTLTNFVRQNWAKPPTADEERAHQLATIRDMRKEYGENFDEALRAANALASRDPRFEKFVKAQHLTNNPWLLLRLAELARVQKSHRKPK